MKKSPIHSSVACAVFVAVITCSSTGFAAETHVIGSLGTDWTYKEKKSTPAVPIPIDALKIGDIIEVKIAGPIPHGIATIKRSDGAPPVEDKSPVLTCGEPPRPNDAPVPVLREIDCGAASKFGVTFTGSLRLEVLATFKDPVDFYCVIHKARMAGVFKLAP